MSYSTFKPKPRAPYIRPERVTNWPAALAQPARAAMNRIASDCVPQPKGEAAKPDKRAEMLESILKRATEQES